MMRSIASPRAVSISTGVSEPVRICRHTSKPSMSGSIRSSTTASYELAASCRKAAAPSVASEMRNPARPRYSLSISARRGSSSTSSTRSLIRKRDSSAFSGARHPVQLLYVRGKGLTLGGGQNVAAIPNELHEALRHLFGELHVGLAGDFQRIAIQARLRERLDKMRMGTLRLGVQRHEISHCLLDERLDLGLLCVGGLDLDVKMLKYMVDVRCHVRRIAGHHHVLM